MNSSYPRRVRRATPVINTPLVRLFIFSLLLVAGGAYTLRFIGRTRAAALAGTPHAELAQPGAGVSVRAAGLGGSRFNLTDGQALSPVYAGAPELVAALQQNAATPRSLATADFDEDGVPDLVSGYANTDGGIITLARGDADAIRAGLPAAQQQQPLGAAASAPFMSAANVLAVPAPPDFLTAGDFNGDGHADVLTAARGGRTLNLLAGDGHGQFKPAQTLALKGRVTALLGGEINRPDGLPDVVVGLMTDSGAEVQVFEGPTGALQAQPEVFAMPAPVSALALGQLSGDLNQDLAVAAGQELLVIAGRDRKLSLGAEARAKVSPASIARRTFASAINALATGDFTGRQQTDLALLSVDGAVQFLSPGDVKRASRGASLSLARWASDMLPDRWPAGTQLVRARLSKRPADDLLLVAPEQQQVHVLQSSLAQVFATDGAAAADIAANTSTLAVASAPAAVLPLRLNGDALDDLVVLRAGTSAPSVVLSVPNAIITVNSSADTNERDSVITLREAILLSNGDLLKSALTSAEQAQVNGTPAPGLDEVHFNITNSGFSAGTDEASSNVTSTNQTTTETIATVEFGALSSGQSVKSERAYGPYLSDTEAQSVPTNHPAIQVAQSFSPNSFPCNTRPFPAQNFTVPPSPLASAAGDFNGDGRPDLAVIGGGVSGNFVSVLINNGMGFNDAVNYTINNTFGAAIAVADLNLDGKLDVIIVGRQIITILSGTGSGGFGAPADINIGFGYLDSVVVGDFNGDGRPDIVVTDGKLGSGGDRVLLLLAKSNGTFETPISIAKDDNPSSAATGDFNADGKLDLAVTKRDRATVIVLLGSGLGSFAPPTTLNVGTEPVQVVTGDVNGDGKLDLAVVNRSSNTVSVLLGTGTGSFSTAINAATGTLPVSLTLADFSGDGKLDLAIANQGTSNFGSTFTFLRGSGTGSFGSALTFNVGLAPTYLTAADFSGNGVPDLAVVNQASNSISLLNGTGTLAGFPTPVAFPLGPNPRHIKGGDFNRDGKQDLLFDGFNGGNSTSFYLLLGSGTGDFAPYTSFSVAQALQDFTVADVNNDGKLDLLVATQAAQVGVLRGNGDGTFQTPSYFPLGSYPPANIAIGDFNNDGKPDVITANSYTSPFQEYRGSISLLFGDGAGSFGAPSTFLDQGDNASSVTVGDLNLDNKQDILVNLDDRVNFREYVAIFLGNGNGTFEARPQFTDESSYLTIDDFNGDTLPDILNVNIRGAYLYAGSGSGDFSPPTAYIISGLKPTDAAVADFNGDNYSDIALLSAQNEIGILLNDGSGSFTPSARFLTPPSGSNPPYLIAADFNNDGKPDLASSHITSQAGVYLNGCTVGPDLTVAKSHTGNFTVGVNGTYNFMITNTGQGATTGAITLSDTLPNGLSYVSSSGTGWSCAATGQTVTCTQSAALAPGTNSNLSITVGVTSLAAPSVTNQVSVSTPGEFAISNNSASDPTTVIAPCGSTPITIGQTVAGALAPSDCRSPLRGANDTFADRYTFSGTAGQQIAITLTSTAFDSFLYLLAPDGSVLVADDDGAGGSDSRIPAINGFFTLPTSGTYTIEATSFSPARTGNYSLSLTTGQTNCTYSITPSAQSFTSTGGGGTVTVTTAPGCAWSATSNSSFITVTGGASGNGTGTVSYTVAANPDPVGRSGTLTIAGQTFTVTQSASAACAFTINPTSRSLNATGGSGTISVTTSGGCNWTAVSNSNFITVTAGASGSGNGTVSYTVAPNTTGAARTGTITVAGQTFTVNQSATSPNVRTITVVAPLPKITDPITIDGTTQPGYAGTPLIEINGSNLRTSGGGSGLNITAGSSTIRALAINRFTSFNRDSDILLITNGNNVIESCYLGGDATGTAGFSPTGTAALAAGVSIRSSSNNRIGGTTAAAVRNIISGIDGSGVIISGGATANLVQGNYIGPDAGGTISLGFQRIGVYIQGASGNTIGGIAAGAGNLISGNLDYGVYLQDDARNNLVQGNIMGTNPSGTAPVPNSNAGVLIANPTGPTTPTLDNTVGGTSPAARNLISGNDPYGVVISAGATGSLVQGNYIGTDATGAAAVPNTYGVTVTQATGSTVGGAVAAARNVISGNRLTGVAVGFLTNGQTGGTGATVQGNFIGTDASGNNQLGNGQDGVFVEVQSNTNTVANNTIAYNGQNGVRIPNLTANPGTPGLRILIDANNVYRNAALGIDLGDAGITANDPLDADVGANLQQNFPTLTTVSVPGAPPVLADAHESLAPQATVTVNGTMNSAPNTTFAINWYFTTAAQCAGNQLPAAPLAFGKVAGVVSDAQGNAAFSFPFTFPAGTTSGVINTTATDPQGNTSEFSPCLLVNATQPAAGSLQFNAATYSVQENGGTATVTVTRSGGTSGAVGVSYATTNGTATAGSDYTTTAGTLSFAAGETTKTFAVPITDDQTFEGDETVNLSLSNPTGGATLGSPPTAVLTIVENDSPPPSLQFSAAASSVSEAAGRATLTVTRTGDTTSAVTVDYRTQDGDTFTVGCADTVNNQGRAYARCDAATVVGTLLFAAGQTQQSVVVPILDDGYQEGNETFQVVLSNPTGGTPSSPAGLGTPATATVTIIDNDTATTANPIFATPFFVREQYLDFLSREPEQGEPWSAVLNNCSDVNNNPACDRLTVSAAFFGSPEFQLKGFYVFRFYKLAFNRLPEYLEIIPDMSFVAGTTPAEVFARKAQLATLFTQRQEFVTAYGSMANAQYVNALLARYNLTQVTTPDPAQPDGTQKVTLTSADLMNRLNANTMSRAQVLRAIADSEQVGAAEFNNAFVGMQYYGYLRRKPEAAGYQAWLTVLQAGDQRTMVNGFMNSIEYRLRFGRP